MNRKVQKYQGVPRLGHLQTHTISSQPRYDHFDTAAYKITAVPYYGTFLLRWQVLCADFPADYLQTRLRSCLWADSWKQGWHAFCESMREVYEQVVRDGGN